MSSNSNRNTLCNVFGKVMHDDLLKRHMNSKHNIVSSTQHYGEKPSQYVNIMVDGQYKADNEIGTETFKVE